MNSPSMTAPDKSPRNAPEPGIYRHYKGRRYQVLGMARHSESEEWLVVYQALYAAGGIWLRPLELWLSPTEGGEARFTLVESNQLSLKRITEPG